MVEVVVLVIGGDGVVMMVVMSTWWKWWWLLINDGESELQLFSSCPSAVISFSSCLVHN